MTRFLSSWRSLHGGILTGLAVAFMLEAAAHAAPMASSEALQQGAYVARFSDCEACHTAPGGAPYAGGLAIRTPIGTVYSTNITPDREHGIGGYSLAEFSRAVRQGIRKDGRTLYPAMPYPSFARMSDGDVAALYAYFMQGVAARAVPNQAEGIRWPLSSRWPLAIWRVLFAPKSGAAPGRMAGDPLAARGAYLVEGPGHCGACHTPRGWALQEKALTPSPDNAYLAGGTVVGGWDVPSLRNTQYGGLGRWSETEIVDFLRDGRTDRAAAFGGMTEVISWSTHHLHDADLRAIAHYLKTIPVTEKAPPKAVEAAPQPAGEKLYADHCAACHGSEGNGIARMFPPLRENPAILGKTSASLIKIILEGGLLPPTNTAPSAVAMPAFRTILTDRQVADVANYVRTAWGNGGAPTVKPDRVSRMRRDGTVSVSEGALGGEGWTLILPQPFGEQWNFSPEPHEAGMANAD